jgi:hypothetical protein
MSAGSVSAPASTGLLRAATYAAVLSGAPSTGYALVARRDPLEATRAAGRLLAPRTRREPTVLAAAAVAHGALSLGWTAVLQRLPRGLGRAAGYGLAIAALDLALAHVVRGRRFGPIADLPVLPQVADHVLFAVLVDAATCGTRLSS